MEFLIYLIIVAVIIYFILNRKKKRIPIYEVTYNVNSIDGPEYSSNGDTNTSNTSNSDYLDNYWIPVESTKRKVKMNLQITYKNTSKIISERQFDLTSFSRGEQGYHIYGFCRKKNKNITLSSLGVLSVTDISNGEIITNLIDYIEKAYKNTINYRQDLLFDEYGWAIYVLVYLSATSGSVIKKERDIIISFIKSLEGFEELSEEWIDKTIKDLYRPGKMEIRNWIKEGIGKNIDHTLLFPWINELELIQISKNREFINIKAYIEKK